MCGSYRSQSRSCRSLACGSPACRSCRSLAYGSCRSLVCGCCRARVGRESAFWSQPSHALAHCSSEVGRADCNYRHISTRRLSQRGRHSRLQLRTRFQQTIAAASPSASFFKCAEKQRTQVSPTPTTVIPGDLLPHLWPGRKPPTPLCPSPAPNPAGGDTTGEEQLGAC